MLDWQPVPEKLVLSDGTLDIWRFSLTQPSFKIQELAQLLCPEEQHRAERFYFQKDRLCFIACRGMLRKILGAYLEVEPSQLQFSYRKRGKPYLKGEQIHFNLSHSQNLALYAVTKNFSVGVDVEGFNQTKPVEQIAQRFFSPREQDVMNRLLPREKRQAFFRAWTRKEAYLKATGEGLGGGLEQVEVSLLPEEPANLINIPGWFLEDIQLGENYFGAVAAGGEVMRVSYWQAVEL
ncbi:MAG: 4'-phosphopantetheinyl transferase superfamily protein [Spirulinaceae cyanobacterium]